MISVIERKMVRMVRLFPGKCRKIRALILALCLFLGAGFMAPSSAYAVTDQAALPVPQVLAPAAALLDADTGVFLYEKDAATKYYPASITKIMTALIVLERCNLDEVVTFSKKATTNLESGAVTVYLTEGDRLTVRDCLYALLLRSANEVANGLAEHVAGSVEAFAELMNKKAAELGCTGTHFVNPNGLNDPQHYTTAHDMALIGKAAFANETLRTIDTTPSYNLPPTKNNPGGFLLKLSNKILNPSSANRYEYAIGAKTGYTSKAGNTLVTCARKDGRTLICVILKSTVSLGQYADTKNLCNYGFSLKPAAIGPGAQNAAAAAPVADPSLSQAVAGQNINSGKPAEKDTTGRVQLKGPGDEK